MRGERNSRERNTGRERVRTRGRTIVREGSRNTQGSKKDAEVLRDFLLLQKENDNEVVQKQENKKE